MTKVKDQYASVMEQLSTGILVFNQSDSLILMNNKAQELLDISERKALGMAASVLIYAGNFDVNKAFKRVRIEGTSSTEHALTIQLMSGEERRISLSMAPINSDDVLVEVMHVDRYLQINRDEELLQQNKMATDMLRGLAHEIKNPLGGLRGAAQLLSKELNAELTDYTDVIIEEADRLRNLVDRMLGSSNLPQRQRTNIHVILERVRQLVQVEAGENINIVTDYDPSIPEISADKDQLIQAALNVVRNATQAIRTSGEVILRTRVQRQFTIGEVTNKLAVKIDVIDDGIGVEPSMLNKVFYPMVTGREGGTGLGLSIAQTNVQRHNGIIEVSSKPGRTVFSIILPLENNHG
ncbi:MAG: PAS domain-containing sensor histidine kinase [Cycloclasticus sp. symbiont of Poecilosclerida sp. M]|nr:MAG: PAS domain-containing sensor histidine kinase [Cycloclasticus sp. symbiont of Poecilosclerida sp. M]